MKQTSLSRPQRGMRKVVSGLLLIKECFECFLTSTLWHLDAPCRLETTRTCRGGLSFYMSCAIASWGNYMNDISITDIHLRHLNMPVAYHYLLIFAKCQHKRTHIFTLEQCPNMGLVHWNRCFFNFGKDFYIQYIYIVQLLCVISR